MVRQSLYTELDYRESRQMEKSLLFKIASFIKKSSEAKTNYREYARLFLLFNSYYLPLDYIRDQFQQLGLGCEKHEEHIRLIRENAIQRNTRKMEKIEKELYKTYIRILESHKIMKQGVDRNERLELYKDCRVLHFVQKSALIKKRSLQIVPSLKMLSQITGTKENTIAYGLKVFYEGLKNNGIKRIYRTRTA